MSEDAPLLQGQATIVGAMKCAMRDRFHLHVIQAPQNVYAYPHNVTNITLGKANNNFPASQLYDKASGFVTQDFLGASEVHITQLHYRPGPGSELVTSGSDTLDVNILLTLNNSRYTLTEITCHGTSSTPNRAKRKTKPRAKASASAQDCWALQQSI